MTAIAIAPVKKSGFTSRAVFYRFHEGAGTSLADGLGNGPTISAAGTTTGAWANAGRWTFDTAGNTLRTTNGNAYIEALFNLANLGGSLITAFDLYYGSIPTTSTETLFGVWLPGSGATGGIRVALPTSNAMSVLYKPSGASEQTVLATSAIAPTTGQRNSYVIEWDFAMDPDRVAVTVHLNGRIPRANDTARNTPPAVASNAGLVLGGYATGTSTNTGLMGAGGSTAAGLARFLAVRMERRDPRLAYAISDYWFSGAMDLPPYMERI
jgi:hypothetical protein